MAALRITVKQRNKREIPEFAACVGEVKFTGRMWRDSPRKYDWCWQRWPSGEMFNMPVVRRPVRGLGKAIDAAIKDLRTYVRDNNLCGDR